MKVRFWGTRGSIATADADKLTFGGNTSCVQLMGDEGTVIILDAGTGMRDLASHLPPGTVRVDILLTHLHMDHIQGLGFFGGLYNPDMEVHIWGPGSTTLNIHRRLRRYLSPPFFPVLMRDLPCRIVTHDVPVARAEIGEFIVDAAYVCHPGPTVGYRITGGNRVLTYMPDHEPLLGRTTFLPERDWISGIGLAEGADMLIHDAQYTETQYRARVGWGHSTAGDAIEFARIAGVSCLVPFHYDPSHKDVDLDRMLREAIRQRDPAFPVLPSREGLTMDIGSSRTAAEPAVSGDH